MIRGTVDGHDKSVPAVLEIPSKEHPYDASKDSILRRARVSFFEEDQRILSLVYFRVCSVPMISNREQNYSFQLICVVFHVI